MFADLRRACEAPPLAGEVREIFVIDGAQIYREALPMADRLYITELEADFAGDTFFPEWDARDFREHSRERHPAAEGHPFGFSFVVLERVVR